MTTKTYQRKLTYGQGKGLKYIVYFLMKLKVKVGIQDITLNLTEHGQPGERSFYRVRVRYYEDFSETTDS